MDNSANTRESLIMGAPETEADSTTEQSIDELPNEIRQYVDDDEQLETTVVQDENVLGKDVETFAKDLSIGLVITLVLSLIIALVAFFGLAMRKKMPKSKFMRYLHEFLNFRKIWVAGILKFVYIFLAASLTIGSVVLMFYGGDRVLEFILAGLLIMIFGNIFLRIGFEMTMIMIGLWENTRDIRGALVKDEELEKPRELKDDDLMEMEEVEEEIEVEEPEE